MSLWQQHYYTWSTKSLSGNKVGLGIVAASNGDRDYLRIAGTEGAKCEACRTEENLLVERFSYSSELHGWVRTGTIPCEQGADRRNNKFVHIQSAEWTDFSNPEEYLCPLSYQSNWDGNEKLTPVSVSGKKEGRRAALAILRKYGLERHLSSFFHSVYHCMLTADKPLFILDETKEPKDFASFSREMMILIHYMIPACLRKDADYVSFVAEKTQEAHFLFGKEAAGKYQFSLNKENPSKEYLLLEKEFFDRLANAFLTEDEEYEHLLEKLEKILSGLADRRNQLEKCIFSLMSAYTGKEKQKDNFFDSMERLMYWARKDSSLLEPLKESIHELDFQKMKEEELLSYTKLMLTGAGGETKTLVFDELNRMLVYFFENNKALFWVLISYIRDNHGNTYEELLEKNDKEEGFTEFVLFSPVKDKEQLENAVKHHQSFLQKKDYKKFLVTGAYFLYQKTKNEEKQKQIGELGKTLDEESFVNLKLKDVEKVIEQAGSLNEFLAIASKLNMAGLEAPIHTFLFKKSVSYMKKEKMLLADAENNLKLFAERINMTGEMGKEIHCCYERELAPSVKKLDPLSMIQLFDRNTAEKYNGRTETYKLVNNQLLAKHYRTLVKEKGDEFYRLNTEEWIRFVLKVSGELKNEDRKLGKDMIQDTKKLILKSNDICLLADVNHILHNFGTAPIHCPESMWDKTKIDDVNDLAGLLAKIEDLSLIRCDRSSVYQKVKTLYEYAEDYNGNTEERAALAWKRYEKQYGSSEEDDMEDSRWKKLFYFAIEDILAKSIWAVLLGFYGFLFVSIREQVAIMPGYGPSIAILILLVIVYVLKGIFGMKKPETPGSIIYVAGVGILLMNWGLALDTAAGVGVLYIASLVLAIGAKIVHYIFFVKQKDETDDED